MLQVASHANRNNGGECDDTLSVFLPTLCVGITLVGIYRAVLQASARTFDENGSHHPDVQGIREEYRRDGTAVCGARDGHDRDDL